MRLHRSHHLTSVLATHNLSVARRTDRVLALDHGKLVPAENVTAGIAAASTEYSATVEARISGDLG